MNKLEHFKNQIYESKSILSPLRHFSITKRDEIEWTLLHEIS